MTVTTDRFGRLWPDLPAGELCPTCGQPDNCGECNHHPLEDVDVIVLGGRFANEADQLLAEYDAGCRGMADIDMRGVLWQIIADVCAAYERAMLAANLGLDITGDINNAVGDYLTNNYGDD